MKNKSATIYIRGIVADNETFYVVSEKQFFLALAQLGKPINVDSRLMNTHKLETYHGDINDLEDLRFNGIYTTLLGYVHNSKYHIHYTLYGIIEHMLVKVDEYKIDTIKANLRINEFVPTKVKKYAEKK